MIDVSEALDDDTATVINVERYATVLENGRYRQVLETRFKTLGSPQPVADPTRILPEGDRGSHMMLFITKKELRATDDKSGTVGDVVTYRGRRWRIVKPGDWTSYGQSSAYGVLDAAK